MESAHPQGAKFLDECSLQKGSGQNQEWVFCHKNEKWKSSMISEESTSYKPAQMVWGAIWLNERGQPQQSPLVIMDHDPDAPCGG
jgi:hypothetical protein